MGKEVERKVVVLGAPYVGKTAITTQFVSEHFPAEYVATIPQSSHKRLKFRGKDFNVTIIDTDGQNEYSIFPTSLCAGVHGYMLVYSVTSSESFDLISQINEKLLHNIGLDEIPRILVGNKTDMSEAREVSVEKGQALATSWGIPFLECSARENSQVNNVFCGLMGQIQERLDPDTPRPSGCVLC